METQDYAFQPGLIVGELLKSSQKDWQAAINQRFVKELFAGTIENKVLKEYLIQDYHFFDAFLSMLGACVAHADQLESKLRFAKQLGFLEADEDGLIYLPKILVEVEIASSNGEARRLIDGGGIKINQQPLPAKTYKVEPSVLEKALLQAGKKRWAQLI